MANVFLSETSLLKWCLMNTPTWPSPCDWNLRCFSVLISVLPNAESRRPFVARGKRAKRGKSRGNCRNAFLSLNRIDEICEQFIHLEGEDSTAFDSWGCKQCLELISFGIHLAGCNKYLQCIQLARMSPNLEWDVSPSPKSLHQKNSW